MKLLLANTPRDLLVSAAIVILTLVLARYAGRLLRQSLDARLADLLSPVKGKTLLRLPALLQYFLTIQGLLLAQNRLVFSLETAALLEPFLRALSIAGQILFLLFLAIALWGGAAIRSVLSSEKKPKKAVAASESFAATGQGPDFKVITQIAELFTDIFKQHLAAAPNTPSRLSLFEQEPSRSKYVFDLQVQMPGGWKSRRISLGRIGAESGSRSKCFYVIFDDYLVVKVPPESITDIRNYVDSLNREAVIARQLELRECIIPRASTIIKYLDDTLREKADDSSDGREKIAMKLLFSHPRLASYLKVGETFAYFMDMSKYYFLQDVIATLHDPSQLVAEEVGGHAKADWKFSQQYGRYGQEAAPLFQAMEMVYAKYRAAVEDLFSSEKIPFTVARHQLSGYFVAGLLGETRKFGTPLPPLLLNRLARLTSDTLTVHEAAIAKYRQTVGQLCEELLFPRSKLPIEGVVANLLELLAHIGAKGVALRDLKPDNLLVAGDRQHYPAFLSRPAEYKIGLIDIETGVIFAAPTGRQIDQPQLGGTPQYATPSHFFANVLLKKMYGDLPATLHLQDWHGMTGVIYKVITNRFLFEKTARIVPAIVGKINNSRYDQGALMSEAIASSCLFWDEAEKEFLEKTTSASERLNKLEIRMPAPTTAMFQSRLGEAADQTASRIKTCITGQTVYSSEKGRQALSQASSAEITKMLRQWQRVNDSQPALLPHQPRALEFLQKLAALKIQHENFTRTLALLAKPSPKISAQLLLNIMFTVVKNHMLKEQWLNIPRPDEKQPLAAGVEATSEANMKTGDREYQTVIAEG